MTWALMVAFDGDHVDSPPLRLALDGVTEVELGRGAERKARREGKRLRVELADKLASSVHARVTPSADGWLLEDATSKNGTMLNGKRVARERLADGDVIECGGTFLLLREAPGAVKDLTPPASGPAGLRTLSPLLERELAMLPKVARQRDPILVRGEAGTGKETTAAAIHALSGRRGPLVTVSCAAVAEPSFGPLRDAAGGTLFLDEIADLPDASQSALLRAMKDGVDVRVVAATRRPLEQLVVEGGFRRDLHTGLRGCEVRLPALRARLEDLGLLIAAVLARLEPGGKRRLSRDAARALFQHAWPDHVRELEQTLRAAVAAAGRAAIDTEHLRLQTGSSQSARPRGESRAKLVTLLQRHEGDLDAVARELTTSRAQVVRLLTRHGLKNEAFKRS